MNYYNEIDPYAAQWLRNLIAAGEIAPGEVDERSIEDVRPADLVGYTQCHFFAGIGGWSVALRLAGWPDDRPVWTGSCPCQPFSAAGKGKGTADERHLWPAWFHLISQCRPSVVFGEQVEAAIKHGWLELVQSDLEGMGYAFGAVGLPAACFAPHVRQRLWFVAENKWRQVSFSGDCDEDGNCSLCGEDYAECDCPGPTQDEYEYAEFGGVLYAVADSGNAGLQGRVQGGKNQKWQVESGRAGRGSTIGGMADPDSNAKFRRGFAEKSGAPSTNEREMGIGKRLRIFPERNGAHDRSSPNNGFWETADWLFCRDGAWRPVEPGTFPLANGIPNRMGRLRAYGNAIVPQIAAEVIKAYDQERT